MNAVDTNVLLYSVDRAELAKQAKARLLLDELESNSASVYLLWQVLGETSQQLKRWRDTRKITGEEYQEQIRFFRHIFPLMLPVPEAFDAAESLAERYSLSHWDSMLLGACKVAGIAVLYTEDMGAPRSIDGIQLVNPFV